MFNFAYNDALAKRPNLGCRLLTWQNAIKILPGIASEITDWVVSTRIKTAQLLYNIILNCEDRITMHVEKIFQFIYKASQDEEIPVVTYVSGIRCLFTHYFAV